MKNIDLAYMAGMFDGEGCICIGKAKVKNNRKGIRFALYLSLGMANKYIPELFYLTFGGRILKIPPHSTDLVKNAFKTQWTWRIDAQKAILCLKVLLPYLRLKRNEAELAIKFQGRKSVHGGVKGIQGHPLKTDEEWAVEEAQYILMRNLKDKSEVTVNG